MPSGTRDVALKLCPDRGKKLIKFSAISSGFVMVFPSINIRNYEYCSFYSFQNRQCHECLAR